MTENSDTLTTTDRRLAFRRTLREFLQVLLFLGVGIAAIALYIDGLGVEGRYACNAEETTLRYGDSVFVSGRHYFTGARLQSRERARSGQYSLLLQRPMEYGFQFPRPRLRGDERIVATVWRYRENKEAVRGAIVCSVGNIVWQAGSEAQETDAAGWERLTVELTLDCRSENKTLDIFCWNPTKDPIYFDDLELIIK